MLPTALPTETQTRYRTALRCTHLLVLAEVEQLGYGYAPLATEKSQLFIDLFHAGYLTSEAGKFYLTEAGELYLAEVGPGSLTMGND